MKRHSGAALFHCKVSSAKFPVGRRIRYQGLCAFPGSVERKEAAGLGWAAVAEMGSVVMAGLGWALAVGYSVEEAGAELAEAEKGERCIRAHSSPARRHTPTSCYSA